MAISTNSTPSAWLDEGDAAILTAMELLEEQKKRLEAKH